MAKAREADQAGDEAACKRALKQVDRRAVRQRFEKRFTATRMAKDYVGTYRQLLRMRTSHDETQSPRPRQLALNGGYGSTPKLIEKPLSTLFEVDANAEVPL